MDMLKVRVGDHTIEWMDERNYGLYRHGVSEKDGSETKVHQGYFNKLDAAVREVGRREADHASDLNEWLERYKETVSCWAVEIQEPAGRVF